MHNTGVRLSHSQFSKAETLARQLGISRNKLFGVLIDNATIQSRMVRTVGANVAVNEKSTSVTVVSGTHALCESL